MDYGSVDKGLRKTKQVNINRCRTSQVEFWRRSLRRVGRYQAINWLKTLAYAMKYPKRVNLRMGLAPSVWFPGFTHFSFLRIQVRWKQVSS